MLVGRGRAAVAAAMIFCALGAGSVFGQAMGKANLDGAPAEAPAKVAENAPNEAEKILMDRGALSGRWVPTPAETAAKAETAKREVQKVEEKREVVAAPAAVQPLVAPASGVVVSPRVEGTRLMMALPEILGGEVPEMKVAAPLPTPEKVSVPVVPATKPVAEAPVVEAPAAVVPAAAFKPSAIEQQPIHGRAVGGEGVATTQRAAVLPAAGTGGSFGGMGGAAQVGAALAIVVGLIFVGRGVARKFVPGAKAGAAKGVIEILARSPLCKNQSLVLVRIGSQIVALNQGKETSLPVLVISDATEVAKIIGQIDGTGEKSISAGFTHLLANAQMDLERGGEEEEEGGPSLRVMKPEALDEQLDEMAAAKRQLMELRQHVRSVRDSMPR